jgi:hypothetical protein
MRFSRRAARERANTATIGIDGAEALEKPGGFGAGVSALRGSHPAVNRPASRRRMLAFVGKTLQ